ncbi:acyl-CoA synthetase (AMP-forming)/AMP-acid ligase II [Caldisphaera lagunensis DSM 15908]|uniref:Acyl-CoA synthetase (AMP-forming)/AMP-acid ligase II n=1 Tax=Caldisphaera lagunensis (strain DSM 15908 / JCM 11604 / ANMR 0165 / IC-154) TaxID=1056495 RepID=L0A913_CALLD|nr:class I adenylate-forming enzyme family protein [Caldisphaera lagunensis]AFZ69914.1 acyl-CoA synthetase (AMP-forming)/AMP-acid ligase II [Caldisphaera lagunensis DSM 15908]
MSQIIFLDKPIFSFLDSISNEKPNECALIQMENNHCITWNYLKEASNKIANWINSTNKNNQVLFACHNTIDSVVGLIGIMKSGSPAALVDPLTISEDLKQEIEGKNIKTAVVSWQFFEREKETLKQEGIDNVLIVDGQVKEEGNLNVNYIKDVLSTNETYENKELNLDDISIIMYYAGVAGRTMQTYHTHRGLSYAVQALSKTINFDFVPNSLVISPITHVLGLQVSLLTPLYNKGKAIMISRWDANLAMKTIKYYNINFMSGAPLVFDSLIDAIEKSNEDFKNTLKLGISAGAPLKPETQDKFYKVFASPLVQAYGMTETWVVSYQPKEFFEIKNTLGLPLYGVEIKVVSPDDPSEELGKNQAGELLVKASWVMKGYEDDNETKKAFYNGYLKTGDLVLIDDKGFLYFKGVKKRMLKYKAYPIFPKDLETILLKHYAVKNAFVFGEKDPDVGDLPVAKVVLKDEYKGKIKEEELINYVNSRVAFYKKIRKIYFVDSL